MSGVRKVGKEYKLYNRSMLDMAMLFNAAFTGVVSLVVSMKLFEWSYISRGYFAIGSEIVVIALIMVLLPLGLWEAEKKWIL